MSTDVQSTFESSVEAGEERLARSWPDLFATGIVGGIDVTMGVLGVLLVLSATKNELASALAFGIGFIALTLANSELFTENFLVPFSVIVARRAHPLTIVRLWVGALVGNLLGGWVLTAFIIWGLPTLKPDAIALGTHFVHGGITGTSFANAILGGAVITLMTWMERGTESVPGKLVAAVAAAFLLAAGHLDHAIVASLEMFAALHAGAGFSYLAWAKLLGWFSLGNIVGGLGFVTVLRMVQVGGGKIEEEQRRSNQVYLTGWWNPRRVERR